MRFFREEPRPAVGPRPVAYITSRFPKLSETFVLNEILELERQGVQVEVYALVREKEALAHPEAAELMERVVFAPLSSRRVISDQMYWLRTHPARYLRAWGKALKGNWRSAKFLARSMAVVPKASSFARHMQASGVRHVHAHWATHPALAAYVVRELTGLPFSFTAHAHDIHVNRTMLSEKINKATFVVTISDYNRRLLESLTDDGAGKVHVIRCGVDTDRFIRTEASNGDGERDGPLSVVCVASLEARKGHRLLLDAVARLRDAGLSVRLSLVGSGVEESPIKAAIQHLDLSSSVTMLGAQSGKQVARVLAGADIYVQPSVTMANGRSEGIPVALMEAMAMGLPAIASNISGIPELITDRQSGLLVPENDPDALTAALQLLCEDRGMRTKLGRSAREVIESEYALSTNVEHLRLLLTAEAGEREIPNQVTLMDQSHE